MVIEFKRDNKYYEADISKVMEKLQTEFSAETDKLNIELTPVQNENKKWGFAKPSSEVVIDFKYDDAKSFCEGLSTVKLNGKWGAINAEGNVVVPFKYDYIDKFDQGFAHVMRESKSGYVDVSGAEVLSCEYFIINDISHYGKLFLEATRLTEEYDELPELIDITGTRLEDYLSQDQIMLCKNFFTKEEEMESYYAAMFNILNHCVIAMTDRVKGIEESELAVFNFYLDRRRRLEKEKAEIMQLIENIYTQIQSLDPNKKRYSNYDDYYDVY